MTNAAAADDDAPMECRDPVVMGGINVKIFNDLPIRTCEHGSAWTQKGDGTPEPFTARSPLGRMHRCTDDTRGRQRQQPGKETAPVKAREFKRLPAARHGIYQPAQFGC
ncbi:hypothetical protein CIT26_01285 [Mesorhizobium temperatum]|uniref:Uncharacterized protein n=1 Tax=Mesorhizobium temperatum TaxID=241416 RepID=A0A271LVQ7_9HYPH|nr:hypothetical protein CIT26_01285 [Mesorhizobium temperatum]